MFLRDFGIFLQPQRTDERRKRAQRGGVRSIGWLEFNSAFDRIAIVRRKLVCNGLPINVG